MKIRIPLAYDATVRTARGDTDKRTYREVIELDVSEADGAPVACRWRGSHIQGAGYGQRRDTRIVDGTPFEPYFDFGHYDHERGQTVFDPLRSDRPDLGEFLGKVVLDTYSTRSMVAALEVKRAGPPRPETVIRSDRETAIETVREFVRDSLRSIDGVLHGRAHLPVLKVRTGSRYQGSTSVWLEVASAGRIQGSEWLDTYPITEFETASAAAKAKAEHLETLGIKTACNLLADEHYEIVDANLATHDVADALRSSLIRHVESSLAYHLVKGSKEAADCYEAVRQMSWPHRRGEAEVSPEDDLAVLMRVSELYAAEGGEDAWFVSAAVERFNRAVGDLALNELEL